MSFWSWGCWWLVCWTCIEDIKDMNDDTDDDCNHIWVNDDVTDPETSPNNGGLGFGRPSQNDPIKPCQTPATSWRTWLELARKKHACLWKLPEQIGLGRSLFEDGFLYDILIDCMIFDTLAPSKYIYVYKYIYTHFYTTYIYIYTYYMYVFQNMNIDVHKHMSMQIAAVDRRGWRPCGVPLTKH